MGDVVEFRGNAVAGAAGAVRVAGLILRVGIAALDDETGDDAMEEDSVVEALTHQRGEAFDVLGGDVREQFEDDASEVGVEDDDLVAFIRGNGAGGGGVAQGWSLTHVFIMGNRVRRGVVRVYFLEISEAL